MDIRGYFKSRGYGPGTMTRTEFLAKINADTKLHSAKEPWLRSLTPSSLFMWIGKNKVPGLRAAQVERITEGKLTKEMLRPDLYPSKGAE